MQTHDNYIRQIAAFAIANGDLNETERAMLSAVKLVYGSGPSGTRGVTFYGKWKGADNSVLPFVEVSAFGQESIVQLTGTTLHELGHALAGWNAGHGPDWHKACDRLGLRKIKAAGTNYVWANFDSSLRHFAISIEKPCEGEPVKSMNAQLAIGQIPFKLGGLKGCQAGIGTRGGKSRGVGSGSRLRLYQCSCGCKVRIASDTFDATHNPCATAFKRAKTKLPAWLRLGGLFAVCSLSAVTAPCCHCATA
jgi:hypothetical protein